MSELAANFFEQTAEAAKIKFRSICEANGFDFWTMDNLGDMSCVFDVVRIGSPDAPSVLVLTPGAREGEGLCASAIQCCVLAGAIRRELPRGVAILLVHSVAPNWKFVPKKRSSISESNWNDALLVAAESRYKEFVRTGKKLRKPHQVTQRKAELSPEKKLRTLIGSYLSRAERIGVIDVRTGPGFYGECDVIACAGRGTPIGNRASRWFGARAELDDTLSAAAPGPFAQSLIANLPPVPLGAAVMEFGTYSLQAFLRTNTGRMFYPLDTNWRTQVMDKAHTVLRHAVAELA